MALSSSSSSSNADLRAQWAAARPDLDTSPMAVVGPFKRIDALLSTALAPLYEGAAVTEPEFDLLLQLRYADGPVIARRLADNMNCSRAAVSKLLAKLESRGYVDRRPSPADRRSALVTATDAGRDVVDAMFPRQLAIEADLLQDLGDDRDRVVATLNLLARTLERRMR